MGRRKPVAAGRGPTIFEHALLGILSLGDKSAYDVRRLFAETPMVQFSSSPGAVYPALKRLEAQGLASSRTEPGKRGSNRRMYRPTSAGLAILDEWLRGKPTREEIDADIRTVLLRFSFMEGRLARAEVLSFLDSFEQLVADYREEMTAWVSRFREMGATHAELGARHGEMAFAMHLRWIATARCRLGEENG